MTILVIGGCHTYGHGLTDAPDFIDQFAQRVAGRGEPVSVDRCCLIDLHQITALLPRLALDTYDLILLQLGHYRLLHPPTFGSLLCRTKRAENGADRLFTPHPLSADALTRLRQLPIAKPTTDGFRRAKHLNVLVKLGLLRGLNATHRLTRLTEVADELQTLLIQLQPHRQRTVLLTPFTHLDPVTRWLRQRGRRLFLEQGRQYGFRVVDADQVIQPLPAYFLPGDSGHLNAVGHERLGRHVDNFCRTRLPANPGNDLSTYWLPTRQRQNIA